VTHAGLLKLAARSRCHGIQVQQVRDFCDPLAGRWVFKASVYKSPTSKGFVGFGDADPSNVSSIVRGAELRTAETRAVNRALRKAYGVGLCSVEELGAFSSQARPSTTPSPSNGSHPSNGSGNGQPRLRDQLCLLIRQYNLDANLVGKEANLIAASLAPGEFGLSFTNLAKSFELVHGRIKRLLQISVPLCTAYGTLL
jgi:hypothetical protein